MRREQHYAHMEVLVKFFGGPGGPPRVVLVVFLGSRRSLASLKSSGSPGEFSWKILGQFREICGNFREIS